MRRVALPPACAPLLPNTRTPLARTSRLTRRPTARADDPHDYWGVIFARKGSGIPAILPRALLCLPIPIGIALLDHYGIINDGDDLSFAPITPPFTAVLGLLMAFRTGDAFRKWQEAGKLVLEMHAHANEAVSSMCSFLPKGDVESEVGVREVRRLVVLGCLLIKQHILEEKSNLDKEVESGVMTAEEQKMMTKTVATVANGPTGDGKKDRFPSKHRPAFAFAKAQAINCSLHRSGKYHVPHTFMAVDKAIVLVASTFEDVEHLGTTVLPLPYAQLIRLLVLIYLLELPLATVSAIGWGVVPLCFLANIVYFLIDESSAEMEQPFGTDENDIPIEKMIRRIDKHTASQVMTFTGMPATNYNLFSETRSTEKGPSLFAKKKKKKPRRHDAWANQKSSANILGDMSTKNLKDLQVLDDKEKEVKKEASQESRGRRRSPPTMTRQLTALGEAASAAAVRPPRLPRAHPSFAHPTRRLFCSRPSVLCCCMRCLSAFTLRVGSSRRTRRVR